MDVPVDAVAEIHLTLSEKLLAELDRIARSRGVRRAHVLREAVVGYLERLEAERVEREMAEYVDALAPYSGEFVAETEEHTMEMLLRETEW